jgi:ankyrin repeat protein
MRQLPGTVDSAGLTCVLCAWSQGRTVLLVAVEAGQPAVVERLVKRHKAKLDARDSEGRTAYQLAVRLNHGPVQALLVRHIRPNFRRNA